ncbi:MAG: PepSY domain-containing protein [Acetobacteraceae bacterium]|nr:PepSY domain-containing protein [Acetobacteraceae bacterium]
MTRPPIRRRHLIRLGGLCLAGGAFPLAPASPASARSRRERDHDRARAALERGEALPLAEVLARVRPELGGEVIGVDFEREDGRWVYEFKVIGPAGRLTEVRVDAATAQVLRRKPD